MNVTSTNEIATLVVRHKTSHANAAEYETWLRTTVATAKKYEGHLGVDIIRGEDEGLPLFTCILRFSCAEALKRWLDSDERRTAIAKVERLLAAGDHTEVSQAREFWFTPATVPSAPPRWKQACLSLIVILPLTLFVPLLWRPLFVRVPQLSNYFVSTLIITLTIVVMVVYVMMPTATRLFSPWLKGSNKGNNA